MNHFGSWIRVNLQVKIIHEGIHNQLSQVLVVISAISQAKGLLNKSAYYSKANSWAPSIDITMGN